MSTGHLDGTRTLLYQTTYLEQVQDDQSDTDRSPNLSSYGTLKQDRYTEAKVKPLLRRF